MKAFADVRLDNNLSKAVAGYSLGDLNYMERNYHLRPKIYPLQSSRWFHSEGKRELKMFPEMFLFSLDCRWL